ncbi:MAG: polysaccharide biosynthesis C-terminal domain-containing protein, partial [Candidatus Krumholzibacteriia bacterium]
MDDDRIEGVVSDEAAEGSAGLLGELVGKLRTDTLRYIPAAIVPAAISVASVSIFTRLFDSLRYGRYALVISITSITVMLLSGWIGQSVLRYLPRFRAEQRLGEFIIKLAVVLTGVALAVTAVFFTLKSLAGHRVDAYAAFLFPAWLLIVSEVVFVSYGAVYQASLLSRGYTALKVSRSVLRLTLALLYVLYVNRDVTVLVAAAGVANLVMIVPMLARLGIWRHVGMVTRAFDTGFLKMLAAFGLPMMGWMIASQVLGLSDRLIIAAFRDDSEVGIYSANYNLVSTGFGLVSGPILTACYPIIINAWERGNRAAIPSLISTFSRYYLFAVLPVVVCLAVFSREVVAVLLGEGFREGHTIIPFIITGVAAWGLSMLGHKGLEILEKTGVMLRLVTVAAGVNIVLNFIVIPRYGYHGAAVTTLVSYLTYPVMVWWVSRQHIRWYVTRRTGVNLVVSGAAMTAAVYGARVLLAGRMPPVAAVVAAVVAGLLLYAGAL